MAGVYKLTLILAFCLAIYGTVMMVLDIIERIALWRHRRKADARIIAQAKGAGVWDKKPIVLGGRALELKAWQDFKIKREPGEPDAHMRGRYMARHDEIDARMYVHRGLINGALQIPPEILYGGDKTDKQAKEETQNE